MAGRASFRRARAVLGAEFSSIRKSDPDLDPLDIAGFTLPILVRALVGGIRPVADHRRNLGVRGVAARRFHCAARVPVRRPAGDYERCSVTMEPFTT